MAVTVFFKVVLKFLGWKETGVFGGKASLPH